MILKVRVCVEERRITSSYLASVLPRFVAANHMAMENTVDIVEQEGILQCPVCLRLPRRPILVCAKQHMVCEGCFIDMPCKERCPMCRDPIRTTRVDRTHMPILFRIFSTWRLACEGCGHHFPWLDGMDGPGHESRCEPRIRDLLGRLPASLDDLLAKAPISVLEMEVICGVLPHITTTVKAFVLLQRQWEKTQRAPTEEGLRVWTHRSTQETLTLYMPRNPWVCNTVARYFVDGGHAIPELHLVFHQMEHMKQTKAPYSGNPPVQRQMLIDGALHKFLQSADAFLESHAVAQAQAEQRTDITNVGATSALSPTTALCFLSCDAAMEGLMRSPERISTHLLRRFCVTWLAAKKNHRCPLIEPVLFQLLYPPRLPTTGELQVHMEQLVQAIIANRSFGIQLALHAMDGKFPAVLLLVSMVLLVPTMLTGVVIPTSIWGNFVQSNNMANCSATSILMITALALQGVNVLNADQWKRLMFALELPPPSERRTGSAWTAPPTAPMEETVAWSQARILAQLKNLSTPGRIPLDVKTLSAWLDEATTKIAPLKGSQGFRTCPFRLESKQAEELRAKLQTMALEEETAAASALARTMAAPKRRASGGDVEPKQLASVKRSRAGQ